MRAQFSSVAPLLAIALAASCAMATPAPAQTLSGAALVTALHAGGYVIIMRHASSPNELPDAATANKENVTRERQLDAAGREAARAMGQAFRRLGITVAQVFTSPTYRARQTASEAGWDRWTVMPELGDRGRSMQTITPADADVLRRLATMTTVPPGTNVLAITHMPNIAAAFPTIAGVADGESLIFKPGTEQPTLVGRVKIGEWPRLK